MGKLRELNSVISDQIRQAAKVLDSGTKHVLVLGRAGTGKSTLLTLFREQTEKVHAVVAPTGVAALNVGGDTIHSFFKLRPGGTESDVRSDVRRMKPEMLRLYRKLECLIVDEISMVRADLFDQMNLFLQLTRKNQQPFGGVRMVMFGDLYQLPPVVKEADWGPIKRRYGSPYFFSSDVWQEMEGDMFGPNLELIELQEIFRQSDPEFINFLQGVRHNSLDQQFLDEINMKIVDETLDISAFEHRDAVVLTTTNKKAAAINQMQLNQIDGKAKIFRAEKRGRFEESAYPTGETLALKRSARIMLVNNDPDRRWINGTMGWVEGFTKAEKTDERGIIVSLDNGLILNVFPNNWEMTRTAYNGQKGEVVREVIGSYRQLPVKLAWAMTIHKSQGKTFEKVIIDLDWGGFATGQTYVALSRSTTLRGIKLVRPLRENDILIDERIVDFLDGLKEKLGIKEEVGQYKSKRKKIGEAIKNGEKVVIKYRGMGDVILEKTITPKKIGEITYAGQKLIALTAFCEEKQELRVFNWERVLEVLKNN